MKFIADLCVVLIGIGTSVSKEVAACERVLAEAGLKTKLPAYGTNIEGEWDDVFAAIKRCHEVVHAMGARGRGLCLPEIRCGCSRAILVWATGTELPRPMSTT